MYAQNILGDHIISIRTTQHLAKADVDSSTDTGDVNYQVIAMLWNNFLWIY